MHFTPRLLKPRRRNIFTRWSEEAADRRIYSMMQLHAVSITVPPFARPWKKPCGRTGSVQVGAAAAAGYEGGLRAEGQPPVKAVRHLPRSAPGKRPTPSTLRALTLMTSRRGLATARAGLSGSSKYMSLTIRT